MCYRKIFILLSILLIILLSVPACTPEQEEKTVAGEEGTEQEEKTAAGEEGAEQGEILEHDLTGRTPTPSKPLTENPKLSSDLDYLIQAERRGEAELYAEQEKIGLVDGSVRVIVECEPDRIEEATAAARTLGVVELEAIVREGLVCPFLKVVVPITSLNDLAEEESVRRVRLPHEVAPQE